MVKSPGMGNGRFFRVWLSLGLQSFGGGMATLALVRRASVEQEQWMTEAEFSRFWALVQLAPGINLLALTVLIGRKTAGIYGIVLALTGLLLPSVAITILLTASYAAVQQAALVKDILRGVIPAIVGLGVMTAWQIARPLLEKARHEGRASLVLSLGLLVGSSLLAWRGHLPVIAILCGAACLSAFYHWGKRRERDL